MAKLINKPETPLSRGDNHSLPLADNGAAICVSDVG